MSEEIEVLRNELTQLIINEDCLNSDIVVKVSQKLDKLINKYYSIYSKSLNQ